MQETKLTHCPKCHKPLLNGARFSGNAEFNLRCPWCQSIVTVTVQQQILAKLKTPENSLPHSSELAAFYRTEEREEGESIKPPPPSRESFKVFGVLYPQDGDENN